MKMTRIIQGTLGRLWTVGVAIALAAATHGAVFTDQGGGVYTATSSGSTSIPDNNLSGVSFGLSFGDTGLTIADVTVNFTISGGFNGDLYAYLSQTGGDSLVLLNRVGRGITGGSTSLYNNGYNGGGFNNITLSDAGSVNIHHYDGTTQNIQPTANGIYLADGQNISPTSPTSSFNADGGSLTFNSQFFGDDPNGNWTLFFADVSSGSSATLQNWTVTITAVPEPATWAALCFGAIFGGVQIVRRVRSRKPWLGVEC